MNNHKLPSVSVIVPCFNEQGTIHLLLEAVLNQDYPGSLVEVVIADGQSTDRTRQVISDFAAVHPSLTINIVENLKRIIPAGLNCAIKSANGEVIVRLDAHSVPRFDYISRCVSGLENRLGDNVGGVWDIHPTEKSWQAVSISEAASHKLGVGDARYRYSNQAQIVETVPFGSYYKSIFSEIGLFDETLYTNEDYEFNIRLAKSGKKVWLDPNIRSTYYSRPTFSELAKQYWRYGYWKAQVIRRYPETVRWRQALPPLFVIGSVVLLILSMFFMPARVLLLCMYLIYLAGLLAAGLQVSIKNKQPSLIIGVPISIAVMHFSWGSAFIWGLVNKPITSS